MWTTTFSHHRPVCRTEPHWWGQGGSFPYPPPPPHPPYPQTKGIHFTRSLLLGLQTPSPEGASGGRGVKDTRWVLGEVSLVANTPLGANPPGV